MSEPFNSGTSVVVMGGGLTGLSAGYTLSKAGVNVTVLERDSSVGGLSKTMEKNGFRFDLGGHRFFSSDEKINSFVLDLMSDELITVARSSRIFMMERYFDYPLRPVNAFFGFGAAKSLRVIADYIMEKVRGLRRREDPVSLEDWVIRNFGRSMYEIYFKVYSEKVWGIDCRDISAEWVDRRISGLSLGKAIMNAFSKAGGRKIPTLVDEFLYPELGIGRMSERLKEDIEVSGNNVYLNAGVKAIYHDNRNITGVLVENSDMGITEDIDGRRFISTLPLTNLIKMMRPAPPAPVMDAASGLRFRDLIVVAIMVKRDRVTDQTWIYVPEKNIPFGRIHEPTNWSDKMAPEGSTVLVIEYFTFRSEGIWNETDRDITRLTVDHLADLGFVRKEDVTDSMVVRVRNAYPLFETGYQKKCQKMYDYLSGFNNLHVAGRSGMFRYYNMDHAIGSGIHAAEAVLNSASDASEIRDFPAAQVIGGK